MTQFDRGWIHTVRSFGVRAQTAAKSWAMRPASRLCTSAFGCAVVALLVTPMPALAQQPVAVVLKGGVAIDTLNVASLGAAQRTDTKTGFVGGLALTMPTTHPFAFQVEFLINERTAASTVVGDPSKNVALFVVPLLLRLRLADSGRTRIGLLVGPEIATNFIRGQGMIQENDDYSIAVGVDIESRRRLVIDLRYTRGLVSLAPKAGVTESVKNRGLAAMFGWRFY